MKKSAIFVFFVLVLQSMSAYARWTCVGKDDSSIGIRIKKIHGKYTLQYNIYSDYRGPVAAIRRYDRNDRINDFEYYTDEVGNSLSINVSERIGKGIFEGYFKVIGEFQEVFSVQMKCTQQ